MACSDSDTTENASEDSKSKQEQGAKTAKTASEATAKKSTKSSPAKSTTADASETKEVVFDPTNPPPGYTKCQKETPPTVGYRPPPALKATPAPTLMTY